MSAAVETLLFATGASPIAIASPNANENALQAIARTGALRAWWRADQGLSPAGWRDRVADNMLRAQRGSVPSGTIVGGANNRPAVLAPAASCLVAPAGLIPADGSFAVAIVARVGLSPSLGAMWGVNASAPTMWGGIDSFQRVFWNRAGNNNFSTNTHSNASGVRLFIWNFRWTSSVTQQSNIRVNQVNGTPQNAGVSFTAITGLNTQFTLFDAGPTTLSAAAGFEFEDVFIFNQDLLADAANLAALEGYVSSRYGLF